MHPSPQFVHTNAAVSKIGWLVVGGWFVPILILDVLPSAARPSLRPLRPIERQPVPHSLRDAARNALVLVDQLLHAHGHSLAHLLRRHGGVHVNRWAEVRAQFDGETAVDEPRREPSPVVDAQEEAPEETQRPEGFAKVLREHRNDWHLRRLQGHLREPASVAPQQLVRVVTELGLVNASRRDGQQVAILQDRDAGLDGAGTDVARLADDGEARDLEEEPISHCVDQTLPLQHDPCDQVVNVHGNGTVIVDDESWPIHWQVFEPVNLKE